jgi:hypothetical protein
LGLSPDVQQSIFNTPQCIQRIYDITHFVADQRERLMAGGGGAGVGAKRKHQRRRNGSNIAEKTPAAETEGDAAATAGVVSEEADAAGGWRVDRSFVVPMERLYELPDVDLARKVGIDVGPYDVSLESPMA